MSDASVGERRVANAFATRPATPRQVPTTSAMLPTERHVATPDDVCAVPIDTHPSCDGRFVPPNLACFIQQPLQSVAAVRSRSVTGLHFLVQSTLNHCRHCSLAQLWMDWVSATLSRLSELNYNYILPPVSQNFRQITRTNATVSVSSFGIAQLDSFYRQRLPCCNSVALAARSSSTRVIFQTDFAHCIECNSHRKTNNGVS